MRARIASFRNAPEHGAPCLTSMFPSHVASPEGLLPLVPVAPDVDATDRVLGTVAGRTEGRRRLLRLWEARPWVVSGELKGGGGGALPTPNPQHLVEPESRGEALRLICSDGGPRRPRGSGASGAVGSRLVAATAKSLAAASRLSTAVVVAGSGIMVSEPCRPNTKS